MKFKFILFVCAVSSIITSCRQEDLTTGSDVVKEWYVPFKSQYTIPAPVGHNDSGSVHIQLLDNNSLRYDYNVFNSNGEIMIGATLNAGDPITTGPAILNLAPNGAGSYGSNVLFNIRQSLVDSLLGTANIYFSIQSASQPTGLVRGQLNSTLIFAADVTLSGANVVPPVLTTATGKAYIRVTTDRNVYSNVTVSNVEPADQVTTAQICRGSANANGPVLIPLVNSTAEFGVSRVITVDESTYMSLLGNTVYVRVNSTLFPLGKLRGQIK
jgi:hypothetical protein